MVLNNYAGPDRGHVAVVSKLVSAREIRVDHANWLDDGSIYVNDPVEDVSDANDWARCGSAISRPAPGAARSIRCRVSSAARPMDVPTSLPAAASPGATALVGEIN